MCPAVTTSASDTGGGYSELTDVRLWHLFVFILVLGILLAIVRDTVGRIALIVFFVIMAQQPDAAQQYANCIGQQINNPNLVCVAPGN